MTAGGNGDDLPEPEIETIRNLVGGQTWNAIADHGAVVTFDGAGVHDNSVDVATLTRVLSHFNGLVRIAQAYRGGLEVKRKGPVTEVKGAGHLAALAPLPGSYAIPLRLDPRPGEMFATDHQELEEVIALILAGGADLDGMLEKLPERMGDELVALLTATETGNVDIAIVALRDGHISAGAKVDAATARDRAHALRKVRSSDVGREILHGSLWRIDTKHHTIAIDAAGQDEDTAAMVTATFEDQQLEQLRALLRDYVEVELAVTAERRSYEQTARKWERRVLSIESWSPAEELDDVDADEA